MSTSINEEVCKSFLSPTQPNVLWEIRCSAEDNVGFHSAADVSTVSQHPGASARAQSWLSVCCVPDSVLRFSIDEKEVLFPPLTMLKVQTHEVTNEPLKRDEETSTQAKFTRIVVTPTFV